MITKKVQVQEEKEKQPCTCPATCRRMMRKISQREIDRALKEVVNASNIALSPSLDEPGRFAPVKD